MTVVTVDVMENKTIIPTKTYERTKNKLPRPISKSGELPVEYESVCRLCLKTHDNMYDIFKGDDIVPTFVKIKTLLNVMVEEDDELPTLICTSCFSELNEFYKFKKRCIANDIQLRQCLLKMPPKKVYNWNDKNLCLENNSSDLIVQKNDCTINWDDQVPLAGIITTEYENLEKVRAGPIIQSLCGPMLHKEVDLTKDRGTSDPKTLEEEKNGNYPAIDENECDELPLAQRLIISKRIEDKTINSAINENAKKIKCKYCKKVMPALSPYKGHKKHCPSRYMCAICSKTFSTHSTLKRHWRVHTGERPFSCDLCDSTFAQKETRDRHLKQVHCGAKPYDCVYCDKRFSLAYLLKSHLKAVHIHRQKYHCAHCPKVFTHASGLSRHNKFHKGARYTCSVCHKNFVDPSSMKRHKQKIHDL